MICRAFQFFRNQTVVHSPHRNASASPVSSHNLKNDPNSSVVNSSLKVAESRQFPVGTPGMIPSNIISPFDVKTFGNQLLPLINVNIQEKVKDFARTFNSGADYIEDALRDSWRESSLNQHNFKHIMDKPKLFKHLPAMPFGSPARKPNQLPTSHHKLKAHRKGKAPKAFETMSVDGLLHEYGVNGYKHFEESILRELEKQEELKVEATIHTLFEQGDRVQIVTGKPYDYKSGWQPVAAPTKNYDDSNDISSQIVSPLHTSIFSNSQAASSIAPHDISSGFHDFDNLNGNTIHSMYSGHEEGESKLKPVKAKIASIKKITPSPSSSRFTASTTENSRLNSRYRKRHNNHVIKAAGENVALIPDSGASGSHDAPKVVVKSKRNPPRHHVQSLTTGKPRNSLTTVKYASETSKFEVTTEKFQKPSYSHHSTVTTPRHRPTTASTTTMTTIKPSRNVPREAPKFVDKTKATGYRGSVRFGQTTKKPV